MTQLPSSLHWCFFSLHCSIGLPTFFSIHFLMLFACLWWPSLQHQRWWNIIALMAHRFLPSTSILLETIHSFACIINLPNGFDCKSTDSFEYPLLQQKLAALTASQQFWLPICWLDQLSTASTKDSQPWPIISSFPMNIQQLLTAQQWLLTAQQWPLTAQQWPLTAQQWPLTAQQRPLTAQQWPLTAQSWISTKYAASINEFWQVWPNMDPSCSKNSTLLLNPHLSCLKISTFPACNNSIFSVQIVTFFTTTMPKSWITPCILCTFSPLLSTLTHSVPDSWSRGSVTLASVQDSPMTWSPDVSVSPDLQPGPSGSLSQHRHNPD